MDLSLKGFSAFVCGSTQGIGYASACELAILGARITLIARNEEKLKSVASELSMISNIEHDYIVVDFQQTDSLETKVENYIQKHPPIHILINNTGGPPAGPVLEANLSEFKQAFSNHLLCNHILVQAVVEGMKKEGYGRIINIVSTSVKQPIRGLGVSNTTRGAVASWAKTLAGELALFGITVNNILPGATNTSRLQTIFKSRAEKNGTSEAQEAEAYRIQIPAQRFAEPKEVAYAVAFLASPLASYITGTSLPVDGGRIQSL